MTELCEKIGIQYSVELARGFFNKDELFDLIPNKSNFGNEAAEGIIVENLKHNIRGKVVRAEFQKAMDTDGHWMHKEIRTNILKDK